MRRLRRLSIAIITSVHISTTLPTPPSSNAASPGNTHELPIDALDYHLPPKQIAQQPVEPRDSARLLVCHRSGETIEHRHVRDLPELLRPRDVMVFNNTFVLPARFEAVRLDTGGHVEGLYLHTLASESGGGGGGGFWLVMLRAGGRLHENIALELLDADGNRTGVTMRLVERRDEQWIVDVQPEHDPQRVLSALGRTPLPPYIRWARSHLEHPPQWKPIADASDRRWYQTVYADAQQAGSIAAPTAGLHFTTGLLESLQRRNIERVDVTLHVGAGTFKPVTAPTIQQHRMHSESFAVSADALRALRSAVSSDRRVIAVGTTAARSLESLPQPLPDPIDAPISGQTDLLIAPGYQFKLVRGLLTNFHLPRSTLLALVAALIGLERVHQVYRIAIEHRYRFYSYGDAMLILP